MKNYEEIDMFEEVKVIPPNDSTIGISATMGDNELFEEELDNDESDIDEGNDEVQEWEKDSFCDSEDEKDGEELEEETEQDDEKNLLPLMKDYKGFTEETLKDAPNEILVELLHMCHPSDRWPKSANDTVYDKDWNPTYISRKEAYDIGRGAVLSEISARGERILHELGYSTKCDTIYVAVHTGREETYGNLISGRNTSLGGYQGLRVESWHLLEVYIPLEKIGYAHKLRYRKIQEDIESAEFALKRKDNAGMGSYYKKDLAKLKKELLQEEIKINNRIAEEENKI